MTYDVCFVKIVASYAFVENRQVYIILWEHPPTKRETSESVSTVGTHSWTETCKLLRMQSTITCKVKGVALRLQTMSYKPATSNKGWRAYFQKREREREREEFGETWETLCDPSISGNRRFGMRLWGTTQTTITVPIKGRSDVGGIVSATMLRKNVSESNTVTSKTNTSS